jgi:predicted GNAT family acetyltransferase
MSPATPPSSNAVYDALGFRDFGTYRLFVHQADG